MPRPTPKPPWGRFTRKTGLAFFLGLLAIGAVLALGFTTAALVRPRDRFTLPLSAIDYSPPTWIDAGTFLAEVRYLGDLPERFHCYDEADVTRIKAAFEKHPWVERVGTGEPTIDRRFALKVVFREPVLLVKVADSSSTAWMVDAHGVLLPSIHIVEGLAELKDRVPPPRNPVGKLWDDATVRRAVSLVKQFPTKSIEKIETGWRITEREGRVLIVGS